MTTTGGLTKRFCAEYARHVDYGKVLLLSTISILHPHKSRARVMENLH